MNREMDTKYCEDKGMRGKRRVIIESSYDLADIISLWRGYVSATL